MTMTAAVSSPGAAPAAASFELPADLLAACRQRWPDFTLAQIDREDGPSSLTATGTHKTTPCQLAAIIHDRPTGRAWAEECITEQLRGLLEIAP